MRASSFLVLAGVILSTAAAQTPPTYSIQMRLVPKNVYGTIPSQLLVTTKGGPLGGMKLSLRATHGFRVNPPNVVWAADEAHTAYVTSADLDAAAVTAPPPTGSVIASLSRVENGVDKTIATEMLDFDYQPAITVSRYLLIAAIGVVVGFFVRMLLNALAEVQSTANLALAATPTPAGLRKFVLEHYTLVNFFVTLVLGILVLLSLMKDGRPPSNAPYWYSALIIGVGLGLLTNSELLTRVK